METRWWLQTTWGEPSSSVMPTSAAVPDDGEAWSRRDLLSNNIWYDHRTYRVCRHSVEQGKRRQNLKLNFQEPVPSIHPSQPEKTDSIRGMDRLEERAQVRWPTSSSKLVVGKQLLSARHPVYGPLISPLCQPVDESQPLNVKRQQPSTSRHHP